MSEEKAKHLLEKYLNGKASPADHDQVENWYAKLDADKQPVTGEQKLALREAMLHQLKLAIKDKKVKKSFFIGSWIKIAAAIIMVTAVSFLFWKQNSLYQTYPTQLTATTRAGEHKKIVLSDGSEITLSPLAKISYPDQFKANAREISLTEGEAFFSIAHDAKRPFHVKLPSHLKVTVLGTSFLIRAYHAKDEVEIAVATGKVAIRNNAKLLGTLVRNQKLQFNKVTGKSTLKTVHHIHPVKIEFAGATLREVIQQIEYVYNLKIVLNDSSFLNLKTTATFNSAQRPEEILDIICSLHHLRFSSDKNYHTFKIYK